MMISIFLNRIKTTKISVIEYTVVMLFICISNLVNPYLSGKFIDYLSGNGSKNLFKVIFVSIVIINILQIILRYFQSLLSTSINNDMAYSLSNEIFNKIFHSEFSQFCNIDESYLIDQINKDCNAIVRFLTTNVTNFILNLMTLLTCLYVLFQIDILLCLILSLTVPCYILTFNFYKKEIHTAHKISTEKSNQYFSRFSEQINKLAFVKRNGLYKQMEIRLKSAFIEKKHAAINAVKIEYIFNNINQIVIIFAYICIIGIGGYKVIYGNLSIGNFTIINTYFTMLIRSVSFFLGIAGSYQSIKVSVDRVESIFSIPNEKFGTKTIDKIQSIQVKNLTISYRQHQILQNCNYEFMIGKIYGIKGANGEGKTTFLNALLGIFYGEHSGNIQYNHDDITNLNMNQIRYSKIAYLGQDPTFLNMDITSFLMLGIDKEPVKKSYLSHISEYWNIDSSLEKNINENGSNFSGGEQQKLSISRILRKSADVILLDEPTSALDMDSSRKLMDLLELLKEHTIIVMISHDTYALDRCDIVFDITEIQNTQETSSIVTEIY